MLVFLIILIPLIGIAVGAYYEVKLIKRRKSNRSKNKINYDIPIESQRSNAVDVKAIDEITGAKTFVKKDDSVKLEVKNLQISFRTQSGTLKAVREISFDLHKGETFAIVGESGSGKSVTSKAIIGILAGNSIVEGGEILYDGQDLLKISEEDYHKIRGDKIAMIFQDPMSSLNPIMRVGQQLTEAMILKAKTSKKNAKHAFNTMLKRLGENINEAHLNEENYDAKVTASKIKTFDNFCIENTKIEGIYNEAYTNASELEFSIENLIFLITRKQKLNLSKELKLIYKSINKCVHEYVLVKNDEFVLIENELLQLVETTKKVSDEQKVEVETKVIDVLARLKEKISEATSKEKPNFFTLAYYKMVNPDQDTSNLPIKELNEMTLNYLNDNFMLDFIKISEAGIQNSHNKSIELKKHILDVAYEDLKYFSGDEIEKKESLDRIKHTADLINMAIDRLVIKKNSTEYVFKSAALSAINRYFEGVKTNPIEYGKYLSQKEKYDYLIANGHTPDWTLSPLVQVDLNLTMSNLRKIYEDLICSLFADIESSDQFDINRHVIDIIDYLKEQASLVVSKMTKKIAKARAIKLMEEVGIPEPAIRFNQYPFEFSGGMRQRIVIAIALSANPDILICDEPTTALDVTIQSQILELINVIKKERNLSVIFITHNLGVVANMADRIAVMYAGKIVEYGNSEEVFYDPRHPYTWALLSSMPDLHTKDRLDSIPGTPPNMIYPPKGDAFAARNKYALEIDFELQPPLFKVTDTHYAATWLLHPDAPKVEMPKIIKDRVERLKKEMEKDGR